MGLAELECGNTKRAKATAVATFKKFLKTENVSDEYVRTCIERDETGKCFVSVMDKFGMYLAFNEGKKGKPLARNTSMQYYRQAKLWLLEQFPRHRPALEARLLKMGKTLDNFCMKRDGGGFITKAPPCSKGDLKRMLMYLYVNASCSSDYQDAALLCLLWYLFGRASDLAHLRKQNLSIDAGKVLFVRFIRMKTSEEQGLSIFPDADFATCPLLAVALALLTQVAPSADVIDNLPEQPSQSAIELAPDVPLLEMLDHPTTTQGLTAPTSGLHTIPTIFAHVNRVLDRIAKPAGVAVALTSHSFRRGGAQHANACGQLTARWIFDRGAWNMTTTNKGFNYIFNTSAEDHKISKILSGHDAEAPVFLQKLMSFDAQARTKVEAAQRILFATCQDLGTTSHNVNQSVLDVLTACVLRHYPLLKELSPEAPAVKRIEAYVLHSGCSIAELLGWSSHLVSVASPCNKSSNDTKAQPTSQDGKQTEDTSDQKTIRHQAAVINHLIEHTQRQDQRMDALEAKLNNDPMKPTHKRHHIHTAEEAVSEPKKKQRRSSVTHLHATWFAWYAQEPRMWQAPISKQQKSDAKLLVAFMKLFLDDGFELDTAAHGYRDQILDLGKRAEEAVLAFLAERKITSRGSAAVLKHLRTLHRAGVLNSKIERHQRLLQTSAIRDPAPGYTQDVLEVVNNPSKQQ